MISILPLSSPKCDVLDRVCRIHNIFQRVQNSRSIQHYYLDVCCHSFVQILQKSEQQVILMIDQLHASAGSMMKHDETILAKSASFWFIGSSTGICSCCSLRRSQIGQVPRWCGLCHAVLSWNLHFFCICWPSRDLSCNNVAKNLVSDSLMQIINMIKSFFGPFSTNRSIL